MKVMKHKYRDNISLCSKNGVYKSKCLFLRKFASCKEIIKYIPGRLYRELSFLLFRQLDILCLLPISVY